MSPEHSKTDYLIIHGHFYQPPRENPWIGRVDRQPSAAPDHDWNERITRQCYAPNASSRILSGTGQIDRIVNNYEYLSFNIGPTLFSWMEEAYPEVARRIVAADGLSRSRLGGGGNAMAQGHGHLILPLCDDQDLHTQLHWGKADFQHRFGRAPAGIWLPETAVNQRTADACIDTGFKFIILSPYQAERIRPIAGGHWSDVSHGGPDPFRPFLLKHSRGADHGALSVFFYHADVSRALAFEGLLKNSDVFAGRIQNALGPYSGHSRVLTIATDGESYGHHEPFGDMCLAALTRLKLQGHNITVSNPEAVLRHVRPTHEVELKKGDGGHGTAWSCSHGVGRWLRHCGCNSGGNQSGSQHWREPLRAGLDHLARDLKRIYYSYASRYFRDAWQARNEYINVILDDYAGASRERFLAENLKKPATEKTCHELIRLLESQQFAMSMFTSCGWFFDDVTGLEPVQNLRYAARAIELAAGHTRQNLHEVLMSYLRRARSNYPQYRDGEYAYRNWVVPEVMDARAAAGREVLVHAAKATELASRMTRHEVLRSTEEPSCTRASSGVVALTDRASGRTEQFTYELNPAPSIGAVIRVSTKDAPEESSGLDWKGLDMDLRERIVVEASATKVRDVDEISHRIFAQVLPSLRELRTSGLALPLSLECQARRSLEVSVERAMDQLEREGFAGRFGALQAEERGEIPRQVSRSALLVDIRQAFETARELGLTRTGPPATNLAFPRTLSAALSAVLTRCIDYLARDLLRFDETAGQLENAIRDAWMILDLETDFGIPLDRFEAENRLFELITMELSHWLDRLATPAKPVPARTRSFARRIVDLGIRFNLSMSAVADQLARIGAAPPA